MMFSNLKVYLLIEMHNMPFFEEIISNLNLNVIIEQVSVTPLQYAANINNIELVQFLLKQKIEHIYKSSTNGLY